jgi:hypoxanthine phosphoribosyltransferase
MNKFPITQSEFNSYVQSICQQIASSRWQPDYVVGISRGGLTAAVMISHYFGIPMKPLQISLRDGGECVSDLGIAEDAFGYPPQERFVENQDDIGAIMDAAASLLEGGPGFKNILVVDDINDTGATINWLMNDWRSGCLPNHEQWNEVWNNNVRFAVIVDNLASKCDVKMDFVGVEINKAEEDVWIEFPYEIWWK